MYYVQFTAEEAWIAKVDGLPMGLGRFGFLLLPPFVLHGQPVGVFEGARGARVYVQVVEIVRLFQRGEGVVHVLDALIGQRTRYDGGMFARHLSTAPILDKPGGEMIPISYNLRGFGFGDPEGRTVSLGIIL